VAAAGNPRPGNPRPGSLGVVVVAAGRSSRMGGVDKTFAPVLGLPLVAHTLDRFEWFAPVDEIVLVLADSSLEAGASLVESRGYRKVSHVCAGGERRQDSVRNGLERLSACELVMVHDGARPCLDEGILQRGLAAARDGGAAVAGMPVKDTIKRVSAGGIVEETPDRALLWSAQTPQVFGLDLLLRAHAAVAAAVTDDAAMVEALGHPVRMFEGSYENIKVTTAGDLIIAESFLRARSR
jgi:2-C-methyl-D-erythritol 4-phosphate cytidylyltransferase